MSARLVSPGYPADRLYAAVARILASNDLCSMATRNADGTLHINTAFFCYSDDLELFFLSEPDSIHCQNVARSPGMAMAVFDSHQRWGAPHRGLQLFGDCTLATGEVKGRARELYSGRFPYAELLDNLSQEKRRAFSLRFYRFGPLSIKILDEDDFGEEVFVMTTVVR